MAEHRAPRVGDRDDEYKARRRNLIISPERHDPFAGKILFVVLNALFCTSGESASFLWVEFFFCVRSWQYINLSTYLAIVCTKDGKEPKSSKNEPNPKVKNVQ